MIHVMGDWVGVERIWERRGLPVSGSSATPQGGGSLTDRVCADVRSRILSDQYADPPFLPSENALCEMHDVSRVTVRRALKQLAEEGWVASRPGKGWEVIWNGPDGAAEGGRVVGLVYSYDPEGEVIFGAARRRFDEEGLATRWFRRAIRAEGTQDLPLESLQGILCRSGVPLSESFLRRAEEHEIPVVCIGHEVHESYDCVSVDNAFSFELLTAYLIGEGHRRVGFLSADVLTKNDPGFIRRESGYRAAMLRHDLRPAVLNLPENVLQYPEARHRVVEWLSRLEGQGRRPTAIICTAAPLANGLLPLLVERGFRVPEDILIMGFAPMYSDQVLREHNVDTYLALENPSEQLGEVGANRLLSRMGGDTSRAHLTLLRAKFVTYRRTRDWSSTTIST